MIKVLSLSISLLSITLFAKAQIKKEQLIGQWQLVKLIDKNISESEKLKRYTFTSDSLIYTSSKRSVKGTFKLNEQTGECFWHVTNVETPIVVMLKGINQDTLHLWQKEGFTTVGVLQRVSK